MKPFRAKPGETTKSKAFLFRVASTVKGITTVHLKTGNHHEAMVAFEEKAKAAREAGSDEQVYLDKFTLEEREVWSQRFNWSMPVKPGVVRYSGSRPGALRILFVPLEIPVWTAARGWSYIAHLAFARALADLGHDVTVLNTEAIRYRELVEHKKWDQVWTHVHFRHGTDHYYREWLADAAPVRLGLAGESVFYSDEEMLANPWYAEQRRAFQDWRPFLTHAAMVAPVDVEKGRSPTLRTTGWPQSIPRKMIRPVNEHPARTEGIFVGAAYPPRDNWIWHPALRKLLLKPVAPEGPHLGKTFERTHKYLHAWMNGVGNFPELALKLYHRRMASLRKRACEAFIGALSQGSCVVNLPSMVKAYSSRVFEGMAAGRPVLSWRPGGEALFHEGTEIVHYGDSPEELAAEIARMQKDPEEALAIARNARENLLANHTTEKRAADLVKWVCEG